MNLTEKLDMLHGWDGPYVGNVPPNTRLGIPALNLNDGPQVCHYLHDVIIDLASLTLLKNSIESTVQQLITLHRASATTHIPAPPHSGPRV